MGTGDACLGLGIYGVLENTRDKAGAGGRTRRCTPGWYIASACIRSDTERALPGAWRRRTSTTFSIGREKETLVETVLHAGQLVPPF